MKRILEILALKYGCTRVDKIEDLTDDWAKFRDSQYVDDGELLLGMKELNQRRKDWKRLTTDSLHCNRRYVSLMENLLVDKLSPSNSKMCCASSNALKKLTILKCSRLTKNARDKRVR